MYSHFVGLITSIILVISMMLSPSIVVYPEVAESESEIEELCIIESVISTGVAIPANDDNASKKNSIVDKNDIHHKQKSRLTQAIIRSLNKEYCVFRE